MQERYKLKIDLESKKATRFIIHKDDNITEYVQLMLKHIGDVDSKLRDDLIYEAFYYWIKKHKYFNECELQEMLLILIDDEHLFYKIGEQNCDSVFTRSLSSLILSLIICCQKKNPFLDKDAFNYWC